jgi:ABC-2 type transport system ATP-binding protein
VGDERVIQVDGLTKVFRSTQRGQVVAVDALDLWVRRGELYGLIGPDGAGKSTTIRLLAGLLTPSSGVVRILGLETRSERQTRQLKGRIGYMSQRANLYGDLTVIENLRLFARLQGVGRQAWEARAHSLLNLAGLHGVEDRLGSQLSGGMRQKLALACVLIHAPEILFLDEPTLGVDPSSRREFWSLLSRLRSEQGVTIFVCTPYMDEAEQCQRVGLLYRGKLLAEGSSRQIRQRLSGQLLDCRPSDLRAAKELAAALPGVIEVQSLGNHLRVFVDDAGQRAPELAAHLALQGITAHELRQMQPRLEEAFISLVQRQVAGQMDPAAQRVEHQT